MPLWIRHLHVSGQKLEQRLAGCEHHGASIEVAEVRIHALAVPGHGLGEAVVALDIGHGGGRPDLEKLVDVAQDQRVQVQEDYTVVGQDLGVEDLQLREDLLEAGLFVGRGVQVASRGDVRHLSQNPELLQQPLGLRRHVASVQQHALVPRARGLEAAAQGEGTEDELRLLPIQQSRIGILLWLWIHTAIQTAPAAEPAVPPGAALRIEEATRHASERPQHAPEWVRQRILAAPRLLLHDRASTQASTR
mmetsp:Transcript_41399/g.105429  ORF Transcript_41399/g.105429 Transcript_41399/m.105429 type:complete len:249 (-) Transcript_41399:52-798(-)